MNTTAIVAILVILVGGSIFSIDPSARDDRTESDPSVRVELMAAAEQASDETEPVVTRSVPDNLPDIIAIDHASAVVEWDEATVFIDPVGDQAQYAPYGSPDIVVITQPHPDHLSVETMIGMLRRDTVFLAPQAVIDEVPLMISNNVITPFEAGTTQDVDGIAFTAIPAYVTRPDGAELRPRERGDIGVVMEVAGTRVYFSGGSGDTPEMRALEGIDTAVVSMNLPFSMGVEEAADAVAAFSPRVVIPYHYRGREGFSDLDEFERLLRERNPSVQVERKEWY